MFSLNLFIAFASTNLTNCTTINESGEYYLQNDIINITDGVCFDIQASNVILDLQGHAISKDDNS